jgi:hypothetical protein
MTAILGSWETEIRSITVHVQPRLKKKKFKLTNAISHCVTIKLRKTSKGPHMEAQAYNPSTLGRQRSEGS